jgi:thiol-disulfide isomerase/thioredoxin
MKKILLLLVAVFTTNASYSQIANGQLVGNFTLTDINGVEHSLYDYLDDGSTVFLDFSATWCGPCWSMHTSNLLKNIYQQHGPAGMPGVNANTTDKAMVIFLEADINTNTNCLYGAAGCNSNTQGNWVNGTPYPIIDLTSNALNQEYQTPGFPTLFVICPNRQIKRSYVGFSAANMTVANLIAEANGCPAPATEAIDGALLSITPQITTCANTNTSLVARVQNNSTTPLTAATITASANGNQIATFDWTGSLDTYQTADLNIGSTLITSNTNITYSISVPGDSNSNNNSQTVSFNASNTATEFQNITIKITLDRYGSETRWNLRNSSGQIVAQNPTYQDFASNGAYPQPDINLTLPNDCYIFTIIDTYGDGMCCSYGQGGYQVLANGTLIPGMSGGDFTNGEMKPFKVDTTLSVIENQIANVTMYPNPTNGLVNIVLQEDMDVQVFDITGKIVYKNALTTGTSQLNLSHLQSGAYIVNFTGNNSSASQKLILK